ncbi:MAG: PH domain-containing protein [Anaerolineae bacterium]|nr:PH domain-containing protein [Anaerolineae bacterium]
MKPMLFEPDARYQTKLFLGMGLLAVIIIVSVALFLAFMFADAEIGDGATTGVLVGILANLMWLLPALALIPAYYRSLRYEIHDDEVIVHVGIITKSVKHVPYRTVTNLEVKRDPFDRMLSLGTLKIQTAGMSGQTGAEESLVGLPDYQAVYEHVAAALRQFRGGMTPTQADVEVEAAPVDGAVLPAILQELQAIRHVLEDQPPR